MPCLKKNSALGKHIQGEGGLKKTLPQTPSSYYLEKEGGKGRVVNWQKCGNFIALMEWEWEKFLLSLGGACASIHALSLS